MNLEDDDLNRLRERAESLVKQSKNVLGIPCICDTPELHSDQCFALRDVLLTLWYCVGRLS
jgi:hypothetical protein